MLYLATFELELTHYMETDSERTTPQLIQKHHPN
jgi:hypothetical protein